MSFDECLGWTSLRVQDDDLINIKTKKHGLSGTYTWPCGHTAEGISEGSCTFPPDRVTGSPYLDRVTLLHGGSV